MAREYRFRDPDHFLARLRELLEQGIEPRKVQLHMPYYLSEADALLHDREGWMRFFPLAGGLFGFGGGLALTIYSVLSWPIITGGKPIVSLPPFFLIGYLMVILFGSLASFGGFLLLARLPAVRAIAEVAEFPDEFVIRVEEGGADGND